MSWSSALKKQAAAVVTHAAEFCRPFFPKHTVDVDRLVSLDFETYYDDEYTLKKLSTSEYVRDPRFKAQMLGIKIGRGKTRVIPAKKIRAELAKINWATHSMLAHNAQFDGFILSHHYDIHPAFIYDTLSMARGLHSNDIGADLDEVSLFYGGKGKIKGGLDPTKGLIDWPKAVYDNAAIYCANDVDEMCRIFWAMLPKMPADEIDLIDITCRMFTSPVLKVDIPRVEKELERELSRRQVLMYAAVDPKLYDLGGKFYDKADHAKLLKGPTERALAGVDRDLTIIKRIVGSSKKFADLLRAEGVEPPVKISPAWMKLPKEERETPEGQARKWAYAFAKDDQKFIDLPNQVDTWGFDLNNPAQVKLMVAKQERLQALVDVRIAVKSTTNITRAQRFLTAGANGMSLPCGYAYYRAHTGRMGGQNKMNMQNLTRGGELRLSILAPPGHVVCVQDSGQIEARVNGWLWGQTDLMDGFRAADSGTGRDAYCNFADHIYGREITKADKTERFVGKVCIAEGELVLTHRGLVPINLISKEDWLWDGVEWVSHDGVIDQGVKEVITHDGLTATPDHEVFTEDGRIIPLGQAASEMARLQNTGAEGQSVRFCDDHVVADTPRKRLSVRQGQMRPDGYYKADVSQQLEERQNNVVLEERAQTDAPCGSVGSEVRRDSGPMHQLGECAVEELRWPRNQVPIQDAHGVHSVGLEEPAAQGLRPHGDRPDQQRRALRAEQFETGDPYATGTQQAEHKDGSVAGQEGTFGGISEPIQSQLDVESFGSRFDRGPNTRKVRVYDIVNAGPRLRYTVSNKLVFNCVLGLGFQMGAPKFQVTLAKGALGGPPVYFSLDQCKQIVNTYRMKNHRIVAGWKICERIIEDMAAGRTGSYGPLNWEKETIWLPNGMALKYPDLRKGHNADKGWDEWTYQAKDMRKGIYGGLLCENIVQALARIIVMGQMLAISRKYRVVMTTHDETVTIAKKAHGQKCIDFMAKCMSTAPAWCADIPLNCEGGFDVNYSK